jgi:DNA primase
MDLFDILHKRGIVYKKTNNPDEILLTCTSGEHEDKNASLCYNLNKNVFNCWSCGFRGGSTKFLASIGETSIIDFDSKQPHKIHKLKDKIKSKIEIDIISLPDDRLMFQGDFKGIDPRVMREFRAFTTDSFGLEGYICVPVYQHGKLRFIESRLQALAADKPKYYRRPQKAVTSDCLFPLDKLKNTSYVILVEGLYDMLNMWQLGYKNTLCIFGATNFSKTKLELLDRLGITRVDIAMDADPAGQRAAEKIADLLDSRNIYARIIKLPEGYDPGILTQKQAERLFNLTL